MKKTGDRTISNLANWLDCIRSQKTPSAHDRAGIEPARTTNLVIKAMRENRIIMV